MLSTPLHVLSRRSGATTIFDLRGELNAAAERPLQDAWRAAMVVNRPTSLLLNFAEVEYINSTGIAVVVSLLAQAQREGVPLHVCGLSEHYTEIFHITRLSDFMPLHRDEAAALAAGA